MAVRGLRCRTRGGVRALPACIKCSPSNCAQSSPFINNSNLANHADEKEKKRKEKSRGMRQVAKEKSQWAWTV
eukprot:11038142-Prorocentrum_lima.AAC.1